MSEATLLVVDDEQSNINLFTKRLEKVFSKVSSAISGEKALEILQQQEIDVLVTDLNMPGINGCELIARAMEMQPMLQSIVITGYGDNKTAIAAMSAGASSYLQKPIDSSELSIAIDKCLEKRNLIKDVQRKQKQLTKYRNHLEELVTKRTVELTEVNQKMQAEIEERKCLETSLRSATAQAENANRAKSEFLANMSHEIRTPMTSAIGLLNIVLDSELHPKQKRYLDMARLSTLAMHNLLNDILDFSKIEAGKLNLESIVFNPGDVIESVIELQHFHAKEKAINLSSSIGEDVPESMIGDPNRLRQIVLNLVSNAVKSTQYGEVLIECTLAPTEKVDSIGLHISVKDTGVGIDEDKMALVLETFSQEESSTPRHFAELGLGLNICSKLVAKLGGRIWIENELGQGCTFHFTSLFAPIPIKEKKGKMEIEKVPLPTFEPQGSESVTILVVEDDQAVQMFIREILGLEEYTVFFASDGVTALQEVDNHCFDMVFLDLNMPGLNGCEVAQQIRKCEKDICAKGGRHLPLIALTGFTDESTQQQCRESGMDDLLAKPFNRDQLVAKVRAHIRTGSIKQKKASERVVPVGSILAGEIFNEEVALENASGNREIVIDRLRGFLQKVPLSVEKLRKDVVAEDALLLEQEIQRLKSLAMEIGAISFADELFSLLMDLRKNQVTEETLTQIDCLNDAFYSFQKRVDELRLD